MLEMAVIAVGLLACYGWISQRFRRRSCRRLESLLEVHLQRGSPVAAGWKVAGSLTDE